MQWLGFCCVGLAAALGLASTVAPCAGAPLRPADVAPRAEAIDPYSAFPYRLISQGRTVAGAKWLREAHPNGYQSGHGGFSYFFLDGLTQDAMLPSWVATGERH